MDKLLIQRHIEIASNRVGQADRVGSDSAFNSGDFIVVKHEPDQCRKKKNDNGKECDQFAGNIMNGQF
jgi:hypothetical protein